MHEKVIVFNIAVMLFLPKKRYGRDGQPDQSNTLREVRYYQGTGRLSQQS
jgi:hypothetical protein